MNQAEFKRQLIEAAQDLEFAREELDTAQRRWDELTNQLVVSAWDKPPPSEPITIEDTVKPA